MIAKSKVLDERELVADLKMFRKEIEQLFKDAQKLPLKREEEKLLVVLIQNEFLVTLHIRNMGLNIPTWSWREK